MVTLLAKILSKDSLSEFYLIITIISFLSISFSFGIQGNLANQVDLIDNEDRSNGLSVILSFYLLFSFLLGLVSSLLALYINILEPFVAFAFGICLFSSISQIVIAEIFRIKNELTASIALGSQAGSVGGTINIALFLFFLFILNASNSIKKPDISFLVLSFSCFQLLLIFISVKKIGLASIKKSKKIKLINPYLIKSSISTIIITAIGYFDIWIPKTFFNEYAAGFIVASTMSKYIAIGTILTSSANIFSLRQLYKEASSTEARTKALRKIIKINATIAIIALLIIGSLADKILEIGYGAAYKEYSKLIVILSIGQALYALNSAYYLGLVALDRFDLIAKASACSLVCILIGIFISIIFNDYLIFAIASSANISILGFLYKVMYVKASKNDY